MIRIALFGQPRVTSEDGTHDYRLSRKTLNVLAYLILHRNRPVTRQAAAFELFPDDDENSRAALRRNLSYLLSALPPSGGEPYVHSDAVALSWNASAPARVDVVDFEAALAVGRDDDALALYAGPLLPTLYDDWTTADRERLRDAAHEALVRTIVRERSRRNFDAATAAAHRLLDDDPWREDVLRLLMAVRYEAGDRAGALSLFTQFRERLRAELRVDPMPETVGLQETVLAGRRLATSESRAGPASGRAEPSLPFAGREPAMARAVECWQEAANGNPGALFVGGHAGVGKSRFVSEFARVVEREGGRVVIGETVPGGERRPYESVIDAFRAASAHHERTSRRPDGARALLERLLTDDAASLSDDRAARVRLFKALLDACTEFARARPLVIVLEDLHWAGSATVDAIGYLLERLADEPVLVVATYRDDELLAAHPLRALIRDVQRSRRISRIDLGPLEESAARAAVRGSGPAAPPDAAVDAIVAWAAGVPLLLSEGARDVAAGRPLRGQNFLDVVDDRFARLSEEARLVLTFAAAIGARFEIEMLGAVCGWPEHEILDALSASIELGLVRATTRGPAIALAFTHHLVHAAVADRIASGDSPRIHGLIARALVSRRAGGEHALEIARHLALAGEAERAAEQYALGTRYALSVFANVEARAAATAGLAALDAREHRRLRIDLLSSRLTAVSRIGLPEARRSDARALLDLLADDEDESTAATLELVVDGLRDDRPARTDALRRLELHATRSDHAAGVYERCRARAAYHDGDFHAAAAFAERSAQAFERGGFTEAALAARLLYVNALVRFGALAEATAAVELLRPSADASDDLPLRAEFHRVASSASSDNGSGTAIRDAERSLSLSLRIGDRYAEARARQNLAVSAGRQRDQQRNLAEHALALQAYADVGDEHGIDTCILNMASIRTFCGDLDEAHRLLERWEEPPRDDPWVAVRLTTHRALLALQRDDLAAAALHAHAGRELAVGAGMRYYEVRMRGVLAEIAARKGDLTLARDEMRATLDALERMDLHTSCTVFHALQARVCAELGDRAAAGAHIAAAEALVASSPIQHFAHVAWNLAAACTVMRETDAARAYAERAAHAFAEEALRMDADLAEHYSRLPWHVDALALLQGRDVRATLAQ